MQMTAWLNEPIDDDTVAHRLRSAMGANGWDAARVAAMAGTTAGRVRMARWGVSGKADRAMIGAVLPASPKTERWRPLVDCAVLLGTIGFAIPFTIGWGARRAMRHDRMTAAVVLLVAVAMLVGVEWHEWTSETVTEWSFRSAQCLVLASLGLLAAGWTAGGLMSGRRRRTLRLAAVGACALLPMLALLSYRTDMARSTDGTKAAIATFAIAQHDIDERYRHDRSFDRVAASYEAMRRLDDTLRLRPRFLTSLQAFRDRESIARACDALPLPARVTCMPPELDEPVPDRLRVTRDLFARVVPKPLPFVPAPGPSI